MSTMTILDSVGATQTIQKIVATGSDVDANSGPVAFSTEGKAQIGSLTEAAPASDTASSGLNGRAQRVAQRLSSLIALTPALGTTADATSSPVAWSTEGKAQLGSLTETAPASDTASSGLNGRMQRLAQRVTSLIAQVPAALGRTTSAASLSVVQASDDAIMGIVTETAPASDTASSGLNGRLQRVAQRITSLIALFPAALGQTTKAASLGVALASDDALVTLCAAPATGTQSIVASSATDVTILASNASRKGAYVYNDSTQVLFLLLSNTASSATVFTQKMAAGDAFTLAPGSYTGVIKGLWASANGSARVTEWS